MSRCRTCDAPVLWVSTPTGKAMPLDLEPDPEGRFVVEGGVAYPVGLFSEGPRYTSHFATCPQADEHRKPRGSSRVRATDPSTSHLAAGEQTDARVGPIRAAVLLVLERCGPITDAELLLEVGGAESSPRKRRGELVEVGWVEPCGEGESLYGRPSLLWRLTPAGLEYVSSRHAELERLAATRRGRPLR